MKLWEVLKELEENPKKVFECDTGSRIKFFDNKLYWYDKHDNPKEVFEIRDKRSGTGLRHNTGDIWQEVKQPVPWRAAIEAWMNGKTISVTQKDIGKRFYEGKDYLLRDQHGDSVSEDEIAEGTWYIED